MARYVLITLTIFPLLIQAICPDVKCDSDISGCFQRSTDLILVDSCPVDQICDANNMYYDNYHDFTASSYSCHQVSLLISPKIPGESCTTSNECRSGICDNGICKGYQIGDLCTAHVDCDIGLTCTGVCNIQSSLDGICNSDYECLNYAGCFNGICKQYLSLDIGSKFAGSAVNPLLCSTGYVNNNNECSSAPKNLISPNSECSSDSDCQLTFGGAGVCSCGYNSNQKSYCEAVEGDDEYLDYLATLGQVLLKNKSCHVSLRFSHRCDQLKGSAEIENYLRAKYIYIYRHLLIDAKSCVVNLVNPLANDYKYVSGGDESESSGSGSSDDSSTELIVGIVIGLVVACLAVLCCFCIGRLLKRRNRSDEESVEAEFDIVRSKLVRRNFNGPSLPKFQDIDFAVDPRNKLFLQVGIPVGRYVDQTTYEVRNLDENLYEVAEPSTPIEVQEMEIQISPTSVRTKVSPEEQHSRSNEVYVVDFNQNNAMLSILYHFSKVKNQKCLWQTLKF